jgi:NADPH-dependent curcumin reductase CurA
MYCQNCGSHVSEDNFDRENFIARCDSCNYISDYNSMTEQDGKIIAISEKSSIPEGLELEEAGNLIVIKFRESKGLENHIKTSTFSRL